MILSVERTNRSRIEYDWESHSNLQQYAQHRHHARDPDRSEQMASLEQSTTEPVVTDSKYALKKKCGAQTSKSYLENCDTLVQLGGEKG